MPHKWNTYRKLYESRTVSLVALLCTFIFNFKHVHIRNKYREMKDHTLTLSMLAYIVSYNIVMCIQIELYMQRQKI